GLGEIANAITEKNDRLGAPLGLCDHQVGVAVAVKVADGKGVVSRQVLEFQSRGAKAALPLAEVDQYLSFVPSLRDQVEIAVVIYVGDGNSSRPAVAVQLARTDETAATVAKVNANVVTPFVDRDQIEMVISVHVADR